MIKGTLFLTDKIDGKKAKKGRKIRVIFQKVKRPTLLLTLYLLTH
jgi:hypothetical protein